MSVPSKALRVAITVASLVQLAACSSQFSSVQGQQSEQLSAATSENPTAEQKVYGDAAKSSTAEMAAAVSPEMKAEKKKLLELSTSNLQMDLERGQSYSKISMATGSAEPVIDVMTLANPDRLVVDILGNTKVKTGTVQIGTDPYLNAVRIGKHNDRTRVVFDLQNSGVNHSVDTVGGVVQVTFLPQQGSVGSVEPAKAEVVAANAPAVSSEASEVKDAQAIVDKSIEKVPSAESKLALKDLNFQRGWQDSGTIELSLSDQSAFDMKRTTPTEYVMFLPGVVADPNTLYPKLSPRGFPGIRTARAVSEPNGTSVRMFVDSGVELQAFPRGNQILVEARAVVPAKDPSARAQAKLVEVDSKNGETLPPEAANPPAEADKKAEPAAADAGEQVDLSDPNTARRNPTGIRSADGSKIYTGRLISLDLQDTDIDNALRIIAEVSNLNIIASDDVTGKVTLRLIDVPWDQALDVILKTNGLDQVTEGNVIRIAPIDKLRQEREALREAKLAQDQLEDLTVQYIRVSYARVDELQEQVESVLTERGTVAVDERTNQLIIKDIKKGHEDSLELIKRLDLRTPQVLLETQIVEGNRGIMRTLGFQWNFNYVQSPATGNATGYNFPNSITVGGSNPVAGGAPAAVNFPVGISALGGSAVTAVLDSADGSRSVSASLSALEDEGMVRIVSRPQVATINNKQAEIRSVETVRIRVPGSGTSIATGSGAAANGGGATAFEEIEVGIELRVTPQASPDYYVLMDVEARSSAFGQRTVDNIPSTFDREATSSILVKSGQTFALGGVYRLLDRDQITGVPWLKDIPFLGHLFRRSSIDKGDEELIFFITPHIVEGSFDPSLM